MSTWRFVRWLYKYMAFSVMAFCVCGVLSDGVWCDGFFDCGVFAGVPNFFIGPNFCFVSKSKLPIHMYYPPY